MSYLIFRNYSTESLGNVYVSQMPSHKKASLRTTEYYVKGRDGALHVSEGYADFELQTVLVLLDAGADKRQIVNAWADGTGKLITSDDLTRAYKATVINEVRWKRVKAHGFVPAFSSDTSYSVGDFVKYNGNIYKFTSPHHGSWNNGDVVVQNMVVNGLYDTATITFTCQPYMYEAVDSTIELTSSGTISNPGSATAQPMIKVEGSGNVSFSINSTGIGINGMTSGVPVYIDCENGYVYTESGAATMTGDIPILGLGLNTVTFGSNVSKITIQPRWRWI